MEKGQGKGTDTLQTDNVFTRKEYIEREAVLQAVCVGCDGEGICDAPALCRIRAWVSKIPAADVVPVVRCGECRYWHRCLSDDGSVEYFNFSHCKKGHNGFPTFFCADGARKDGDGE